MYPSRGIKAYAPQYIRSIRINIHGDRLNPDWAATSVHLFLWIYPFIYGVHTVAYSIRPYRMQNRCPKKGMIIASAAWLRFRFPIIVRACGTVQVSFPDYCPCIRNGSDFVSQLLSVHAERFRFRFPIIVRACGTVRFSFSDYCPCMRNDSDFVF